MKFWWSVLWRMYAVMGVLASPMAIVYVFVADQVLSPVDAIKLKQTFVYCFIAAALYMLQSKKSLLAFIWSKVTTSDEAVDWINKAIIGTTAIAGLSNLMFAMFASVDAFVSGRMLIGSMVMFVAPTVIAVGVKYKEQKVDFE
jgi:hypothetical protein